MRRPDEIIGDADDPYMLRWHVFRPGVFYRWLVGFTTKMIHRNRRRPRRYLPSIYLHEFLRSDDDRHFHDHVGWSVSIVLKGGYWEVTPDCADPEYVAEMMPELIPTLSWNWTWVEPWSIAIRSARMPHFIALGREPVGDISGDQVTWKPTKTRPDGKRVLSLWIRGPWRRNWGFFTKRGWVDWETYTRGSGIE